MKKNTIYSLIIAALLAVAATVTAFIFNTSFAKLTIDIWSFAAALFIIIEAAYKIIKTNDTLWPNQFMRLIRIIIGVCVFTIHTCQVIYGI